MGSAVEKPENIDIRKLFDGIAGRYDFLNRLLSLGIDVWWRRQAVSRLRVGPGERVLDLACGTADVALEIARRHPDGGIIVAADFSLEMLRLAQAKIARAGQSGRIFPVAARCEALPHPDRTFDAAVIAFGIRNVSDRLGVLRELFRVLRPGGRLAVLELSTPANPLIRAIYHGYFRTLLPWLAGFFAGRAAYRYLPASVAGFPAADRFRLLLEEAGFDDIVQQPLTFGIATLHCGRRPE
ncbi:MAG: bifunctional demethylmenaquinone methyltransferase/2-methoxy-6-polyprenyl-1,4-benzoquinol methylase UbiE [Deltaproteobacteria bacterium]|nr:bifunctional demethylmenaquinone methyltransferase/2-methoxy-6-polyprenyl-1,4-benzoquinol methylase UbiE [Deltaproteobacteria bacterium]